MKRTEIRDTVMRGTEKKLLNFEYIVLLLNRHLIIIFPTRFDSADGKEILVTAGPTIPSLCGRSYPIIPLVEESR